MHMAAQSRNEVARRWRENLKKDPIRYAKFLMRVKRWRKNCTPEQKAKYKESSIKWHLKHPGIHGEYHKTYARKLKQQIIDAYGKKCKCCQEQRFEFLALDHINGGGTQQRKKLHLGGTQFYKWIRQHNFPQGSLRILCHNCNQSFGAYGYCPHNPSFR